MQLGLWWPNLRHINAMFWTIAFFFARIRTLSITCCAFKQSQWCHVEPYFNSWCHSWYCDITSWNLIYTQQHLWVIQRGSTGLSFGGGEGELSLTQLSLVCGRVNPLLSGTHAAPVQHRFTQNASVWLCSGARQWGWQQTRNPVTHTRANTQQAHHLCLPFVWRSSCQ